MRCLTFAEHPQPQRRAHRARGSNRARPPPSHQPALDALGPVQQLQRSVRRGQPSCTRAAAARAGSTRDAAPAGARRRGGRRAAALARGRARSRPGAFRPVSVPQRESIHRSRDRGARAASMSPGMPRPPSPPPCSPGCHSERRPGRRAAAGAERSSQARTGCGQPAGAQTLAAKPARRAPLG